MALELETEINNTVSIAQETLGTRLDLILLANTETIQDWFNYTLYVLLCHWQLKCAHVI